MDCEVCGSLIFGKGIKVLIDGAQLIVCPRCAGRAAVVKTQRPTSAPTTKSTPRPLQRRPQPQTRRTHTAPPSAVTEDLELIGNYAQVIRKAREAMQLSQEDLCHRMAEKVSVLQKIESGRLIPDDSLVKKLEHALKIHLLQQPSKTPPAEEKFSRPMELTLGDVAIMQKRRTEGEDAEERR